MPECVIGCVKLPPTVLYMACSVQISDYFSVEPQARFLNFTIYLFIGNRQILKIWRLSKYALTSFNQLISYELYTVLGAVIFWFISS